MSVDTFLQSILSGEFDGEEGRIYDAIKTRRSMKNQTKVFNFRVGDTVKFNHLANPKYLRGVRGRVTKVNKTTVAVNIPFDSPARRFAGSTPRCPVAIVDKVEVEA